MTTNIPGQELIIDLGAGVALELVWIPPGEFEMGSSEIDENPFIDYRPMHHVRISMGFWMGKYVVMQEQWERVMEWIPTAYAGSRNPVEQVNWEMCQEFLRKLNQKAELIWQANQFRLPTEAEWEYACRAGTQTRFYSGDDDTDLDRVGWYEGNSQGMPHAVGEKAPNAWGLYDTHGNVMEWCSDWYGEYPSDSVTNPTGPDSGSNHVSRGGSWLCSSESCRVVARFEHLAAYEGLPGINTGFRLVMTPNG